MAADASWFYPTANGPAKIRPPPPPAPPVAAWRWIIACSARPQISDVAIQSFLTPQSVQPGEAFVLSAWVQSPTGQEMRYQLKRGDDIIAAGSKNVAAGLTRLMFRDRAGQAGVNEYTVTVQGPRTIPCPKITPPARSSAWRAPRPSWWFPRQATIRAW